MESELEAMPITGAPQFSTVSKNPEMISLASLMLSPTRETKHAFALS
jgi:hypothetical protein